MTSRDVAADAPAKRVAPGPSTVNEAPAAQHASALPADRLSALLARAVRARASAARPAAARLPGATIQRVVQTVADSGETLHTRWGDGLVNVEPVPDPGDRPIIVELMTDKVDNAIAKVNQIGAIVGNAARATQARLAIVILLNSRVQPAHVGGDGRFTNGWTTAAYTTLTAACRRVADRMDHHNVLGACIPAVWRPTGTAAIYPLPYLEMRARLTLHPATQKVVDAYVAEGLLPLVRGMDADVRDDPLLEDRPAGMGALDDVYDGQVLSGGYDWDTTAKPETFWPKGASQGDVERWNRRWTDSLVLINTVEHQYRERLLGKHGEYPHLLYWPEPNIYMTAADRRKGAGDLLGAVKPNSPQMRESIFYVKSYASTGGLKGKYDRRLKTTKPAKDDYFTDLRQLILDADKGAPTEDRRRRVVEGIRQTHLSPSHISDIQKSSWYDVQYPTPGSKFETMRQAAVKAVTDRLDTILTT